MNVFLFLATAPTLAFGATPTELLGAGSTWSYLDDGIDPGPSWPQDTFDDSAWPTGPAPLGYGIFGGTLVSYGADPADRHVTTWFRQSFSIVDPADYTGLTMEIRRDDGAVVYLNGVEVHRTNLPSPSTATTLATSDVSGVDENEFTSFAVPTSLLVAGDNQVAVEIHQASPGSDDLAFDLAVTGWSGPADIVRGPYLQNVTSTSAVVRWRTDLPNEGQVEIDGRVLTGPLATDHAVEVTGLSASTSYSYTVGSGAGVLSGHPGDPLHEVRTLPVPGTDAPVSIWVIGDAGTANADQEAVRDAWLALGEPADAWLMLGDNAYNSGTDTEYQAAVFDIYDDILPNTALWSTLGNHDGYSASSADQTGPYYEIFTLPTAGEAGGEPSGTEAYYSFDVGDVHLVCLDSYDSDRQPGSAMLQWLEDDLSATSAQWIIAFWHHPPYSKGSHDSDFESYMVDMRENALPILEAYGVDLVLTGHSHSYERSMLVDGHYDVSSTFDTTMQRSSGSGDPTTDGPYTKPSLNGGANEGAVYVVAGSSGKISGGALDHPIMHTSMNVLGSMVLDVEGDELRARFLTDDGSVLDAFTIERGVTSILQLSTEGPAWEAEAVRLHAYAQDPSGAEAVSYSWDFGDGTPAATGSDVVHIWPDDGTFAVTVSATDAGGTTVHRTLLLDVQNQPPVIRELSAEPASEGVPFALHAAATDVSADTVQLAWDFGDGTTAFGTDVEHVYLADGTYTVTVTASDEDGGVSSSSFEVVVADLPVDQQSIYVSEALEGGITVLVAGNDPEAVSWSWDFFDGLAPRTSATVEHIWRQDGLQPVTLTVTDAEGDTARTAISVTVQNVAPSDLQVSQPFGGDEGQVLTFTASASDPGDDVLQFTWYFGDAAFPSFGSSVQHAYADDGVYEVSVTVDDGDGGLDELEFGINIANVAPSFSTFQVPTSLAEGEAGLFLALGTDPGTNDDDDVTWDLGDGSGPLIASEVRHSYAAEGVYAVTATLDDGDGGKVVQQGTVSVRNAPPRFLSTPTLVATAGERWTYPANVEELGDDLLTYELVGPAGSGVGPAGVVFWTPARTESQVPFTLVVRDGTDEASQSWFLDVVGADGLSPTSASPQAGGGNCGCSSDHVSGDLPTLAPIRPFARRR